uniref:Uncharacterized protein n=1 Tax=Aegilops tauschii subsp. strangulata TaxID=200361 RepID=A0A453CM15_AEGTS
LPPRTHTRHGMEALRSRPRCLARRSALVSVAGGPPTPSRPATSASPPCGPLLLRLYFLRGGSRKWLSSLLQTAGCPLLLVPLGFSYSSRRRRGPRQGDNATASSGAFLMTHRLLATSAVVGLMTGADNFLYAYGQAYLPVSTSSILISTQLAFTAAFALLLVRQRFTGSTVNATSVETCMSSRVRASALACAVLARAAGSGSPSLCFCAYLRPAGSSSAAPSPREPPRPHQRHCAVLAHEVLLVVMSQLLLVVTTLCSSSCLPVTVRTASPSM